jgi:hypothetical protein
VNWKVASMVTLYWISRIDSELFLFDGLNTLRNALPELTALPAVTSEFPIVARSVS